MKNVTVSIPDDVYREARIQAAQQSRSVSSLVREYLEGLARQESEFDRLLRLQQDVISRIGPFDAANRLTRDEVHDRAALR